MAEQGWKPTKTYAEVKIIKDPDEKVKMVRNHKKSLTATRRR